MNGSALYHFVSEGAMKAEINAHRYIEFGKHKQHLYGIKVDSVLEVVESGRMCVLDVNPQVRSLAIDLTHNFVLCGCTKSTLSDNSLLPTTLKMLMSHDHHIFLYQHF